MSIIGAGANLQVLAGSYTTVAGITSIGGLDISVKMVNVSTLQSPSIWEQFLPGFKNGGNVPFEAVYDHLQFNTLLGYVGVMQTWRIIFSDGSKWDFTGLISAIKSMIPLEEAVTMPFSLQVSGIPTFTP